MLGPVLGAEDSLSDCHTSDVALESNDSLAALNKNVMSIEFAGFLGMRCNGPCALLVPSP